jgi:hypothetical protein
MTFPRAELRDVVSELHRTLECFDPTDPRFAAVYGVCRGVTLLSEAYSGALAAHGSLSDEERVLKDPQKRRLLWSLAGRRLDDRRLDDRPKGLQDLMDELDLTARVVNGALEWLIGMGAVEVVGKDEAKGYRITDSGSRWLGQVSGREPREPLAEGEELQELAKRFSEFLASSNPKPLSLSEEDLELIRQSEPELYEALGPLLEKREVNGIDHQTLRAGRRLGEALQTAKPDGPFAEIRSKVTSGAPRPRPGMVATPW